MTVTRVWRRSLPISVVEGIEMEVDLPCRYPDKKMLDFDDFKKDKKPKPKEGVKVRL